MQYYGPDNNERGKRIGLVATIIYMAVWLVLFLTLTIKTDRKLSDDGILIDFGAHADGMGAEKPAIADKSVSTPQSRPQPLEQINTQDFEDAPEVKQPKPQTQRPVVKPQETTRPKPEPQQPQETEKPQEVNRRALFPGRNPDSGSQSAGTGSQPGNQGNPDGSNDGSSTGTGTGSEGHSFSLAGRQLAGSFPEPTHPGKNKSGKVLIEITVDGSGTVVTARHLAQGSTTTDGELVEAARKAALRAKFTPDENNPVQRGTITYIFRLK